MIFNMKKNLTCKKMKVESHMLLCSHLAKFITGIIIIIIISRENNVNLYLWRFSFYNSNLTFDSFLCNSGLIKRVVSPIWVCLWGTFLKKYFPMKIACTVCKSVKWSLIFSLCLDFFLYLFFNILFYWEPWFDLKQTCLVLLLLTPRIVFNWFKNVIFLTHCRCVIMLTNLYAVLFHL